MWLVWLVSLVWELTGRPSLAQTVTHDGTPLQQLPLGCLPAEVGAAPPSAETSVRLGGMAATQGRVYVCDSSLGRLHVFEVKVSMLRVVSTVSTVCTVYRSSACV